MLAIVNLTVFVIHAFSKHPPKDQNDFKDTYHSVRLFINYCNSIKLLATRHIELQCCSIHSSFTFTNASAIDSFLYGCSFCSLLPTGKNFMPFLATLMCVRLLFYSIRILWMVSLHLWFLLLITLNSLIYKKILL